MGQSLMQQPGGMRGRRPAEATLGPTREGPVTLRASLIPWRFCGRAQTELCRLWRWHIAAGLKPSSPPMLVNSRAAERGSTAAPAEANLSPHRRTPRGLAKTWSAGMANLSCPQIVRSKTFGHVDSKIVQRQIEFSSAPSERFSYLERRSCSSLVAAGVFSGAEIAIGTGCAGWRHDERRRPAQHLPTARYRTPSVDGPTHRLVAR